MNNLQKLRITYKKKVWEDTNENHSWSKFALHLIKNVYKGNCNLVYCDIWKIIKVDDEWLILDECGHYENIPEEYKVEVLK